LRGRHPTPELMAAFLAGEVDDATAVALATHFDSCPTCRQRAFAEDDLHAMLMEADEQAEPPPDLIDAILASPPPPPSTAGRAPVIAMAMLAAAGFLLAALGNPAGLVAEGAAWGRGLTMAATAVGGPSGLGGWVAAPGLAITAAVVLLVVSKRVRPA